MRFAVIVITLFLILPPVAAGDVGFTLAPWSFTGGVEAGTYVGAGFNWGLSPRFEAELLAVGELTPHPGNTLLGGMQLGISLLGPRIPTYFNTVLDLGYLHGVEGLNPQDRGITFQGVNHGNYLFLRLSPLAIGNPRYRMRDRIFTVGVLYHLEERKISWTWNWVIFGRYFP